MSGYKKDTSFKVFLLVFVKFFCFGLQLLLQDVSPGVSRNFFLHTMADFGS
jgi:hypothetical protein